MYYSYIGRRSKSLEGGAINTTKNYHIEKTAASRAEAYQTTRNEKKKGS